ncbi:cellulose binding domain-containing protein [Saccharothrix australiensis]|uniref:Parallel beta helix pectate lyase-like protein n=1 Tax=Saccharothrix australiensis TaxID=2072 RepID=A0A495VZN6_9PSEU|nr:cellulose binding domain-containing protein [Saccharothrix australiensis]RKT54912.1 parallel beta helix pectate lyase-like protein [Saccharothrix australiensis]
MRRHLSALLAACAVALCAPPAEAAAARVTAAFGQDSVWSTGYRGGFALTNTGDAETAGWVVEFDLPAGSTVTNSWNSALTRTGQRYRFANAASNGRIRPGGTAGFGFTVSGSGLPTGCTVDGVACGGVPVPDTAPPSAPGGPRVTGVTAGSVSLAWRAATDDVGVTDYQVLDGSTVVATATATTATVTGLLPGAGYAFTVRARDAAGNTSPPSTAVHATTGAPDGGSTADVSTAAELRAALADAVPGRTIRLAAGVYRGAFTATRPGTASAPITLTGPADAVLVNDGPSGAGQSCPTPTAGGHPGYGLWLHGAPHWNLTGFTVRDSKKGIVVDDSHHTVITRVSVHHVAEEGVHFRRSSADGVLRDSTVTDTGLAQPGYGEGVYIGSAHSNWDCHGNSGGVDRSDRVRVLGNRIGPGVAAEPVDVKEGTSDGVIRGNTFDGSGISGQNSADSWIDVKGVRYAIEDNTGTFAAPGAFANGYETHNPATTPSFPNGCGNVWRGNRSDLGGVGRYAVKVTSTSKCAGLPNVVHASNTVTRAVVGLTNIAVTP